MTRARPWMAVVVALAGLLPLAPAASAQTQTFTGGSPLSFGEMQATPYPSTLDVSGMSGAITDVNVILQGVTLTATNLDMLLVSPTGNAVLLTSDVPTAGVVSQKWTFDDAAPVTQVADQLTGVFQPTNLSGGVSDIDTLPMPAPAEYDGHLSSLNGGTPDGTWKLYAAGSGLAAPLGGITGWSLRLTTDFVPQPAISIDPASIDFGTVTRERLAPRILTITNTGTGFLTADTTGFFSPDFGTTIQDIQPPDLPCGAPLAAGESCKIEVMFTPVTTGAKSATLTIVDNAPGSPHTVPLTGTLVEPAQASQTTPDSGSPDVTVQQAQFTGPTAVGQPSTLHVEATDDKEPVTGLLVDFGESLGVYGASACSAGMKAGSATFDIPYTFRLPGSHTVKVTVFASGCGKATSHTTTFTTTVGAPKAARRVAHAADTIAGPNITSKCKNAAMLPSKKKANLIIKAVLCVINEQRKLAKLKPLKLNKRLAKAAVAHNNAMVGQKFFAHQGPKEKSLAARLKKARYRGAAGENIGAGGGPLGSPVGMVNGWMHSTLHRANILEKKWRTVGIAFAPQFPVPTASQPVATFTTDFGSAKR